MTITAVIATVMAMKRGAVTPERLLTSLAIAGPGG